MSNRTAHGRAVTSAATAAALSLTLAACTSGSSSGEPSSAASGAISAAPSVTAGAKVTLALITKDATTPYFVAMAEAAQQAADANSIELTVTAGAGGIDVQGQVAAIEAAVASARTGILITPAGAGVNDAISAARAAGLLVIALDSPTDPVSIVDATFATDNFVAGQAIGQWMAGKLDGDKASIARLFITDQESQPVDSARDNGFLDGMGIDVIDPAMIGDEPTLGEYATGKGGQYEMVCAVATGATEVGGRRAMEDCLAKNPDVNVVYAVNDLVALGAAAALKQAGRSIGTDVLIVSVDGGVEGLGAVKDGVLGATAQQDPRAMAEQAVKAAYDLAKGGAAPPVSSGKDFVDTGVVLCTDEPQDTVVAAPQESVPTCLDSAWG